jgi:DNA-binding NarL/FixJ family response regulator
LIAAVKGTMAGETFLDPAIAGKVLQQAVRTESSHVPRTRLMEDLTPREPAQIVPSAERAP